MKATLILEDGTIFEGTGIGKSGTAVSEVVFNTSMTGYPEVLTDPSYAGQAVCMTYPLIGNYGVSAGDLESRKAWPDAFIVRELSRIPSNFRSEESIDRFLLKQEITGIAGIDTRALTRLLREKGTMNGMITTEDYLLSDALERIRAYEVGQVVDKVTIPERQFISGHRKPCASGNELPGILKDGTPLKVALIDYGCKRSIALNLSKRGIDVTLWPARTEAEEILASHPDGIMLSNGPGDPKENTEVIAEIRKLYESDIPIFAICLGHQLMALATGADTKKMKYGHRGGNHPVRDLLYGGHVSITSQNHGYMVDVESVDPSVAVPAFENVNDGTNEGLSYIGKNIFTVQFHPEASPGPEDANYLFDRFLDMMKEHR